MAKCTNCGQEIEYGSKFCKECGHKTNWEETQNNPNNKNTKKTNYFKIINLFCISFFICLSAVNSTVINNNIDITFLQIILYSVLDFVIYTLAFMIFPLIYFIKNHKNLSYNSTKKFKINSIIITLIISFTISILIGNEIGSYHIDNFFYMIGGTLIYAFIYYYINKWFFIKNTCITNKPLLHIVFFIILIIFIVLGMIGGYGINTNTPNKYNTENSTLNDNSLDNEDEIDEPTNENELEKCNYKATTYVTKIEINAESSAGVGDVFSTMDSDLKYRIIDNKIGDTFEVTETYSGDESIYECNEKWYEVKLNNGEKGYVWGGYQGMYVREIG